MLSFMRKKFSPDNSNRKKKRKKSARNTKKPIGSSSGRKLLHKTLSSFSDVLSSVENIPHNIDVAQWILGVESPAFNSGYRPISPAPPVPVRSSSRLAVPPQNISALKNLLHQDGYNSPKMYATDKKNRHVSKQMVNAKTSKDKSKIKSSKTGHKHSKSAPKDEKTGLKPKRSDQRNKSGSPQLKAGERYGWQYITVTLNRLPTYGLGIAVSGGRDNPHFIDGDPSIVISDILKSGPADGKLKVNDRVISVNGISLENVDYNTALQVLRETNSTANLLIKRRVLLQNKTDTFKLTLTKNKKKDDFGIVLGCKVFIKQITNRKLIEKNTPIQEGDFVLKLNHTSTEDLSLKEVKKLIESGKNKLKLVIKREQHTSNQVQKSFNEYSQSPRMSPNGNLYDNMGAIKDIPYDHINNSRANWTNQNIYVQTPITKGYYPKVIEDKNNLNRMQQQQQMLQELGESGRNREQFNDISYGQFDHIGTPPQPHTKPASFPVESANMTPPPPRPPPPRPPRPMNVTENERTTTQIMPNQRETKLVSRDPRLISFQKDSSGYGIRLTGGNQAGIFVCFVQPASLAALHGLQVGDKILKINNTDTKGLTREEAVLFLYSLEKKIYLIVQHMRGEYDDVIANRKGDSFYIRVYFNNDSAVKGELAFSCGEIFHVIDTVFNDCIGSWLACRLTRTNHEIEMGIIPNQIRAEKYANALKKKVNTDTESPTIRANIFRRSTRKTDSVSTGEQFSEELPKVLAYERVTLKQPNFIRPVVLFGPIADMARDRLVKEYPDYYELPKIHTNNGDNTKLKIKKDVTNVSLSAIKNVVDKGKHALLTVTPDDVQRLNYSQLYPIVILLTAENKMVVKELRLSLTKSMRKNSRKLFDEAVECEKLWPHLFTATITVKTGDTTMWFETVRETIEIQQLSSIWMSEFRTEQNMADDDTLFPVMSSISFAASRENSDSDFPGNFKFGDKDSNAREMVNVSSKPSVRNTTDNSLSEAMKLSLSMSNEDKLKPKIPNVNNTSYDKADYFRAPTDAYSRVPFHDMYSFPVDARNQYIGDKKFLNKVLEIPPSVDRINKPFRYRTANQNFFAQQQQQQLEKPLYTNGYSSLSQVSNQNYAPFSSKPVSHDFDYGYGNSFPFLNDSFAIDYKHRYDSVMKHLSPSTKFADPIQRRQTPPQLPPPPPILLSPPSPKIFNYYPVHQMTPIKPYSMHGLSVSLSDESEAIVPDTKQLHFNKSFGYFVNASKDHLENIGASDEPSKDGNDRYSYSGSHTTFRPHLLNETISAHTFDDNKRNVIATASGVFNSRGGILTSDKTDVCLVIPENAIPEGVEQEIYFKVCRDTSMAPPLDPEKGETLLSPIVMCGPHGLRFEKPVELRLPHCVSGNADSWSFALKSSDATNDQWENVNLETIDGKQSANSKVDNNFVSVLVDHF